MKRLKRKKLTAETIEKIVNGELAIMIIAQVDNIDIPVRIIFTGKATLHIVYPKRNSFFEVVRASDKFYFKEFDYFWFVVPNKPPKNVLKEKENS